MSESSEFTGWLIRIFNIFAGIIYITAAILIFAQIDLDTKSVLLFLAIILIIISVIRILNGFINTQIRNYLRISRIIVGIIILVLAILAIVLNLTESTVIILLAIAILINGIQRLLDGSFEDFYPVWFRVSLILVGVITIVICAIAISGTSWNVLTLIILIAVTFMLNGLGRIMNAIYLLEGRK